MGALPKFVFCVAAIASAVIYTVIVYWLVSVSEIKVLTAAQHGAALAYGIGLSVWAGAEAAFLVFRYQPRYVSAAEDEEAASEQQLMEEKAGSDAEKPISPALEKIETTASIFCIRHSHLPGLRAAAEFIVILGYIYGAPNLRRRTAECSPSPSLAVACPPLCGLFAHQPSPLTPPITTTRHAITRHAITRRALLPCSVRPDESDREGAEDGGQVQLLGGERAHPPG